MPLTSPSFLLFLCAVAALYWLSPAKARVPLLLAASYLWYAASDPFFLVLLLGTTAFDFQVAKALESIPEGESRRAWFLAASLCGNLAVLVFFKISPQAAPLGVSFYTFHSISYVVDVYRRNAKPERSFLRYALYVAFFPKIVAGPIERFADFSRQLLPERAFAAGLLWIGALRITYGLFLKLVVGDSLALVVARAFDHPGASGSAAILGIYAYAAQIYADFFGYTLIARGAALLFGLELELNFLSPYCARSPQDFWRRWHRSLSFWFRDYLYVPLGGNRRYRARNVLITMALAGLWHGASAGFLAWGLYHGVLLLAGLAVSSLAGKFLASAALPVRALAAVTGWFLTLQAVCLGWVFFRAPTIARAFELFGSAARSGFRIDPADLGAAKLTALLLAPWILIGSLRALGGLPHLGLRARFATNAAYALAAGLCIAGLFLLGEGNGTPFIYFRF